MILREIYTDNNSEKVTRFFGNPEHIKCIGVSNDFDGEIKYLRGSKEYMQDLFKEYNIFGVYAEFLSAEPFRRRICLSVPDAVEVKLLNLIDDAKQVRIPFNSGIRPLLINSVTHDDYLFFVRNFTDNFKEHRYCSILEGLINNDFEVYENKFYIADSEAWNYGKPRMNNDTFWCIEYTLNCSEDSFRRFLVKVKTLK